MGWQGRAGIGEEAVAPRRAFPAMQSLKGEPRHYAVAAVHGPLPHHPFDSSSFLVAFLFLLPLSLSFSLTFSLLFFSSLFRPTSDLAFLIS